MSSAAVAETVRELNDLNSLDDAVLQEVFGACLRAYSARSEALATHLPPYLPTAGVTPTHAIRAAAGLLREADITSFDLAMMFNV
jgi:hypothetical protein